MKIMTILFLLMATSALAADIPEPIQPWVDWPVLEVPSDSPETAILNTADMWRLDCGPETDEVVGKIVAAAPGLEGRTLLVDGQVVQILVVGPNGEVERTVGQKGEGPGDYPGAYRAFQLTDGRLGVSSGAPAFTFMMGGMGKIVLLDEAEDPAGVWHGAGDPGLMPASSLRDMRCVADRIMTASQGTVFQEGTLSMVQELCLLDPPDGDRTVVARKIHTSSLTDMTMRESDLFEVFAEGRCDISAAGRVAFAPDRDLWRVAIHNPDGSGLVLERPWTQVNREKEAIEKVWSDLGGNDDCVPMETEPAIGRIRWRPDGRLWVEPVGIRPEEGAFACFDEFSPSGKLLRRVHLRVPGDSDLDEIVFMENGQLALLRGFKKTAEDSDASNVATEVVLLEILEK